MTETIMCEKCYTDIEFDDSDYAETEPNEEYCEVKCPECGAIHRVSWESSITWNGELKD